MESIHIHIAGRAYPLTVPSEEVAAVKAAAERVNQDLAQFQEQYGVDDPVDLLAMSALQWATKALHASSLAEAPQAEKVETLTEEEEQQAIDLLRRLKAAVEP